MIRIAIAVVFFSPALWAADETKPIPSLNTDTLEIGKSGAFKREAGDKVGAGTVADRLVYRLFIDEIIDSETAVLRVHRDDQGKAHFECRVIATKFPTKGLADDKCINSDIEKVLVWKVTETRKHSGKTLFVITPDK